MTALAWLMNLDFAASGSSAVVSASITRHDLNDPVWAKRWRTYGGNGLQWIRRDEWKQKSSSPSPA